MWIIHVLGCPLNSYFGPNCSRPCPINCQERRCDINTGHCLGCVPGYKGHRCEKGIEIDLSHNNDYFFKKTDIFRAVFETFIENTYLAYVIRYMHLQLWINFILQ